MYAKDQLISKANCQVVNSSKKWTIEFVFTTMQRVFVCFLKEIEDTKKTFRNHLTFKLGDKITRSMQAFISKKVVFFESPHSWGLKPPQSSSKGVLLEEGWGSTLRESRSTEINTASLQLGGSNRGPRAWESGTLPLDLRTRKIIFLGG